jgi:hypothetical protein
VADFAHVNEFLLPPEKATLDLTSYVQEVLFAPGLGQAQEAERARLRSRVEIIEVGGKRVLSLKGHLAISYSVPAEATIRTNGFRLRLEGGDYSGVRVEVGVRPDVRRAATVQMPEVTINALKPPVLVNQTMENDPEGPYPASRGPRGAAADINRCNTLVKGLTQNVDGFPGDRASCDDDLAKLDGRSSTMKLTFSFADEDVPVTPERGEPLSSVVALQNGQGQSIFTDLSGAPCVFADGDQARDTCVTAQFRRDWTERADLNEGGDLAAYLQAHHGSKFLPDSSSPNSGGYAGPRSVVATKSDRNNPNEKLTGQISATPILTDVEGKLYGYKGYWDKGGTAYNAIANKCMEDLRGRASVQDMAIPGAQPDTATKVAPAEGEVRTVSFQTSFPGLTLIDSVSFSSRVRAAAGGGAGPNNARESLTCTLPAGRGGTLKIETSEAAEFITMDGRKIFRFKEGVRNDMRPLAAKVRVLGEPGKDGFDAPVVRAAFPENVDEKQITKAYETLAGAAGLPGLALGYPNQVDHPLTPGKFEIGLADSEATTAIQNIDEHLLKQYCVKVTRTADGIPTSIEYFPVAANFPQGNEVKYEFGKSLLRAEAKASFDIYTGIKGMMRLAALPALEVAPSTDQPGQGSVQGFGGGIRVGSRGQAISALSGFWGFNKGMVPAPFQNGYAAYDGDGGASAPPSTADNDTGKGDDGGSGSSTADGDFKGTWERTKEWARELLNDVLARGTNAQRRPEDGFTVGIEDNAPSVARAKEVIPLSRRFQTAVAEIDCKGQQLFQNNQITASSKTLDMSEYKWTARTARHMWITDGNFPTCGQVNGAFVNPGNCKQRPRGANEGEPVFKDKDGKEYHRFPNSWAEYREGLKRACETAPAVQEALNRKMQGDVNESFYKKCQESNGCRGAWQSLVTLTSQLSSKANKQLPDPASQRGRTIDDERFHPKTLSKFDEDLRTIRLGRGDIEKSYNATVAEGRTPEIGEALKIDARNSTITNLASLDSAISEYETLVALMREVARPGIRDNALPSCSYSITGGRFRYYGEAKITSPLSSQASAQAKATNLRTSLVAAYTYPKGGASSVTDQIQTPDVSPLFGNGDLLVLKDPDIAKPGKAGGYHRSVVRDCADIANQARRDKMPLPRLMFTSNLCRTAKANVN